MAGQDDKPRWSVSSARMPKGDSPERARLVGQKNEHPGSILVSVKEWPFYGSQARNLTTPCSTNYANDAASSARLPTHLLLAWVQRASTPRYRPPGLRGVAFHVLSAEAALGAGFDLERIGLRAVRGSAPSLCPHFRTGIGSAPFGDACRQPRNQTCCDIH
jgi:hypothetical protein